MNKIIDFHTHIFPEKIAQSAVRSLSERSGISPVSNGTKQELLQMMDEAGIDISILASVATKPEQHRKINLFLNEQKSAKLIPFGALHPLGADALEEIDNITALGFKGIKLHPDYQNFYVQDKALYPVYKKCAEKGLIILFHAGVDVGYPEPVHAEPAGLAQVAKDIPELKMVCAHFGSWRQWDDVEKYICPLSNVWIDTSFSAGYIGLEQAKRIAEASPDRVMLGSDYPWENPKLSVELINSLDISQKLKRKILGENAAKLLDL